MAWDLADFVIFGALVAGVGVTYALARRKSASGPYRSGVGVALAAAFLLVWLNGAVGIIGDEGNDANLMYAGVLAVAVLGAAIARFEASGMFRAMGATALAQVLVAAIATAAGWGSSGPLWPLDLWLLTAIFAALWLSAAWLFRKAAAAAPAGPPPASSRGDEE